MISAATIAAATPGLTSLLSGLANGPAQRDVWRWGEPLDPTVAGVGLLFIVVAVALIYLAEPKVRRGGLKVVLYLLRATVIAACALLLFDPIESKETVEVRDAYSVMLVDKSVSMTFKDRYEPSPMSEKLSTLTGMDQSELLNRTRMERVRAALTNPKSSVLRQLREKNKVKIYGFDSELGTVAELDQLDTAVARARADGPEGAGEALVNEDEARRLVSQVKAEGSATAIGDALSKVQKLLRSEKLAGVVLLTDGRQNAGSLDPIEEAQRYGRRRIPIHTVGVGDPREPRDLAIDNLQAPDVSIVGDLIAFDCTVKARGYTEAVEVDVELLFNGEVRERTRIKIGGDTNERAVRLRTKPDRPGEYQTEVRVTVLSTEMSSENNRATHLLRVIDQRIKVLYIDGYPRWEYRFLKNALVRDRSMEVQCLLLNAEPQFPQEASPGLPRLARVPSRRELLDYHVIILGDVSPQARWPATGEPVFRTGFWDTLTEFVGDFGGGLLVISGERDNPKRMTNTPLTKLLPVVVDERTPSNARYTEIFYPQLTRLGAKSPLMRLEPDERRNAALWRPRGEGLPGFYWYERVIMAKPIARVLATHPTESNEHGNYPLFAWSYYKSGTVFWSGVDSTWRWRAGVGDKYNYRFYGQIIRFLSHGRFQRSKRFSITTDKTTYTIGDEVHVTARVYDREMKPSTDKEQLAELEQPDGTREKLSLRLIGGKPGRYETFLRATRRGTYRATLLVGDAGSDEEIAPRKFEVKLPSAELAESRMDEATLQKMAEVSGGKYVRLADLDELPELIPSMRERIPLSASEKKLWDNWQVMVALMTLLVLEWIGRRSIKLL